MATYIESTISACKDVPDACSKSMKMIGDLDAAIQTVERSLDIKIKSLLEKPPKSKEKEKEKEKDADGKSAKDKAIEDICKLRKIAGSISDRKVNIATKAYDIIDKAIKFVDDEIRLVEKAMRLNGHKIPQDDAEEMTSAKKRKRGGGEEVASAEPIYCLCRKVAYGDMVSCDNEACDIEWFHFPCVGLTKMPKGSWYCKSCKSTKKK